MYARGSARTHQNTARRVRGSQTTLTFRGSRWIECQFQRQFEARRGSSTRLRDGRRKYFIARLYAATTLMTPTRWMLNIVIYERAYAYRLLRKYPLSMTLTADRRLVRRRQSGQMTQIILGH